MKVETSVTTILYYNNIGRECILQSPFLGVKQAAMYTCGAVRVGEIILGTWYCYYGIPMLHHTGVEH